MNKQVKRTLFPLALVLMVSVFPVVFLFCANAEEVGVGEIMLPLLIYAGVGTVLFVLLSLLMKNTDKSAIITTVTMLTLSNFALIQNAVSSIFPTVVEHLKYVNQYRRESGRDFKIYVTGILTRFTENLKDEYHRLFDDLTDQVVFKYVYNQGGYMPEIDYLLKCECDKETFRRCNLPFDALCVTCEGYLSVENADYENMLIVGDLNKTSLRDAWYGEKMKQVRQMFMDDCLCGTLCDGCVHHDQRPAEPLMPEYATPNEDMYEDFYVRERIKAAGFPYQKMVYVPMAADIVHPGHINIIHTAAKLGRVVVGLFTDDAIRAYKPEPYMNYEQRKTVVENLKGVALVVPQLSKDYEPNLRRLRPDIMVHGTDWREGPLADVRKRAIEVMAEWGGEIVEPEYTRGVSSSQFKAQVKKG